MCNNFIYAKRRFHNQCSIKPNATALSFDERSSSFTANNSAFITRHVEFSPIDCHL